MDIRDYKILMGDKPSLEDRQKMVKLLQARKEPVSEGTQFHKADKFHWNSFNYIHDIWCGSDVGDDDDNLIHIGIKEFLRKFSVKPIINQREL